jgi:hypothetical protein
LAGEVNVALAASWNSYWSAPLAADHAKIPSRSTVAALQGLEATGAVRAA